MFFLGINRAEKKSAYRIKVSLFLAVFLPALFQGEPALYGQSSSSPPVSRPSGASMPLPPSPVSKPPVLDLPSKPLYPLALLREIEDKSGDLNLLLRYQGAQGDYLVFYGSRGEPLYLRYREDRFDTRKNAITKKLLPGRIYEVSFSYPEEALPKPVMGPIRRVRPLKKGVYFSNKLFFPESFRF